MMETVELSLPRAIKRCPRCLKPYGHFVEATMGREERRIQTRYKQGRVIAEVVAYI